MIEFVRMILYYVIFTVLFLGVFVISTQVLFGLMFILLIAPIKIILHKKGISISDENYDKIFNYAALTSFIIILIFAIIFFLQY
jgi:hypothetical protein